MAAIDPRIINTGSFPSSKASNKKAMLYTLLLSNKFSLIIKANFNMQIRSKVLHAVLWMFAFFLTGHGLMQSDVFSNPSQGSEYFLFLEGLVGWLLVGAYMAYMGGIESYSRLIFLALLWFILFVLVMFLTPSFHDYLDSLTRYATGDQLVSSIGILCGIFGSLGGLITTKLITNHNNIFLKTSKLFVISLVWGIILGLGSAISLYVAYFFMMLFDATINAYFSIAFGLGMAIIGYVIGLLIYKLNKYSLVSL